MTRARSRRSGWPPLRTRPCRTPPGPEIEPHSVSAGRRRLLLAETGSIPVTRTRRDQRRPSRFRLAGGRFRYRRGPELRQKSTYRSRVRTPRFRIDTSRTSRSVSSDRPLPTVPCTPSHTRYISRDRRGLHPNSGPHRPFPTETRVPKLIVAWGIKFSVTRPKRAPLCKHSAQSTLECHSVSKVSRESELARGSVRRIGPPPNTLGGSCIRGGGVTPPR